MPITAVSVPNSTDELNGGVVGAASAHAALADNSDSSYVRIVMDEQFQGNARGGMSTVFRPNSSYRAHRLRILYRTSSGTATPSAISEVLVRTSDGDTSVSDGPTYPWPPTTVRAKTSEYNYVHPDDQEESSLQFEWRIDGISVVPPGPNTQDFFKLTLEVEYRSRPTHTSDVRDRAGNSKINGTISDTQRPRIVFSNINPSTRDDLPWFGKQYHIKNSEGETVVDVRTTEGLGAETIVGPPLENGDYTVEMTTFSKIGDPALGTSFPSETAILAFTIDFDPDPTFIPDVQDLAGTSKADGTIENTSRARFVFGSADIKGLDANGWSVVIKDAVTNDVVQTLTGEGEPPSTVISEPLVNGSYVATLTINTIDYTTEYSTSHDLAFSVDYQTPDVNTPIPLVVTEIKFHVTALPRRRGETL